MYARGTEGSLGTREAAARALESELAAAGANPVRVHDRRLAAFLEREGRLVRLAAGDAAVGAPAYDAARNAVVEECERAGSITLARARDLLGVGRGSAQLLLERMDADGVTRRIGNERVLRRATGRAR